MPRKVRYFITLPSERPRVCNECPLCGWRPKEDLPAGSKRTRVCVLTNRYISGRGAKTEALRRRCWVRQWDKIVSECRCKFEVGKDTAERYKLSCVKPVEVDLFE